MPRSGITYEDVATAAQTLQMQGIAPTVDRVREALNSTGSKSTIAPHLKTWKEQAQPAIAQLGLPGAIEGTVRQVYDTLRQTLESEFQERAEKLEQVTLEAQERTKAAEIALEQARVQLVESNSINDTLSRRLTHCETERDAAQDQVVLLSNTIAHLENRQRDMERQLKDALTQIENLHGQVNHQQAAFAEQRLKMAEDHAEQVRQVEVSLAAATQELRDRKTQITQLETQLQRETEQTHAMQSEMERLRATLSAAQEEVVHANRSLARQVGICETQGQEIMEIRQIFKTRDEGRKVLVDRIDSKTNELGTLAGQFKEALQTVKELAIQLKPENKKEGS